MTFLSVLGVRKPASILQVIFMQLSAGAKLRHISIIDWGKGMKCGLRLRKPLKASTLFLVIFSENYASSTWCLKEIAKILDCTKDEEKEQRVIPVFYKIEPTHVRKQCGSYQKAFEEHEQKKMQQVQQWRETLTLAANLSGWPCTFDT